MAFDAQMAIFVTGSGLVGWLANALVARITKDTDGSVIDLRVELKAIKESVQKVEVTLEGMRNGFVTRDKLDDTVNALERRHQRDIDEAYA